MKIQKKPFAYLDFSYKERANKLSQLICALLESKLVMVIVKRRTSIFELIRYKSLFLIKGSGYRLYSISHPDHLKAGVNLLVGCSLWHISRFHILIGNNRLLQDLNQKCTIDRNKEIRKIEENLESIVGAIDPLDDILECYGDEPFKSIILSVNK